MAVPKSCLILFKQNNKQQQQYFTFNKAKKFRYIYMYLHKVNNRPTMHSIRNLTNNKNVYIIINLGFF